MEIVKVDYKLLSVKEIFIFKTWKRRLMPKAVIFLYNFPFSDSEVFIFETQNCISEL